MEGIYLTSYGVKPDILSERAKLSFPNFQEGADYNKLKEELNSAKYYANLSDLDLKTGRRGFMHFLKRFLQIYKDCESILDTVAAVRCLINGHPLLMTINLIALIISRLIRLGCDTIEFNAIEEDANKVLYELYILEYKLKKAGNKNQELSDVQYSIKNLEYAMKETNCDIQARRPIIV